MLICPLPRVRQILRRRPDEFRRPASALNRLGTVLLTVWVFFLLGLFSLCTLFLGMLAYGHMTRRTNETESNAHAANAYGYMYHYVLRRPAAQ